jgi:putative exosortase-associated protein (TIGR04073 family)
MKKVLIVVIISAFILSIAGPGYGQTAFKKLGRGVVNLVTCAGEVPDNVMTTYHESGVFDALGLGLCKGFTLMIVRGFLGLYETVTFLFPLPEDYQSVIQPDFFWQKSKPVAE